MNQENQNNPKNNNNINKRQSTTDNPFLTNRKKRKASERQTESHNSSTSGSSSGSHIHTTPEISNQPKIKKRKISSESSSSSSFPFFPRGSAPMDQELLNQLIMQFESVSGLGMGGPLQNIFSSMGVNPLSPASSSASATLGQDESLEMLLNSGSMRSNLRVLEIINAEEKNDPEKESFLLLALEEICQRYSLIQEEDAFWASNPKKVCVELVRVLEKRKHNADLVILSLRSLINILEFEPDLAQFLLIQSPLTQVLNEQLKNVPQYLQNDFQVIELNLKILSKVTTHISGKNSANPIILIAIMRKLFIADPKNGCLLLNCMNYLGFFSVEHQKTITQMLFLTLKVIWKNYHRFLDRQTSSATFSGMMGRDTSSPINVNTANCGFSDYLKNIVSHGSGLLGGENDDDSDSDNDSESSASLKSETSDTSSATKNEVKPIGECYEEFLSNVEKILHSHILGLIDHKEIGVQKNIVRILLFVAQCFQKSTAALEKLFTENILLTMVKKLQGLAKNLQNTEDEHQIFQILVSCCSILLQSSSYQIFKTLLHEHDILSFFNNILAPEANEKASGSFVLIEQILATLNCVFSFESDVWKQPEMEKLMGISFEQEEKQSEKFSDVILPLSMVLPLFGVIPSTPQSLTKTLFLKQFLRFGFKDNVQNLNLAEPVPPHRMKNLFLQWAFGVNPNENSNGSSKIFFQKDQKSSSCLISSGSKLLEILMRIFVHRKLLFHRGDLFDIEMEKNSLGIMLFSILFSLVQWLPAEVLYEKLHPSNSSNSNQFSEDFFSFTSKLFQFSKINRTTKEETEKEVNGAIIMIQWICLWSEKMKSLNQEAHTKLMIGLLNHGVLNSVLDLSGVGFSLIESLKNAFFEQFKLLTLSSSNSSYLLSEKKQAPPQQDQTKRYNLRSTNQSERKTYFGEKISFSSAPPEKKNNKNAQTSKGKDATSKFTKSPALPPAIKPNFDWIEKSDKKPTPDLAPSKPSIAGNKNNTINNINLIKNLDPVEIIKKLLGFEEKPTAAMFTKQKRGGTLDSIFSPNSPNFPALSPTVNISTPQNTTSPIIPQTTPISGGTKIFGISKIVYRIINKANSEKNNLLLDSMVFLICSCQLFLESAFGKAENGFSIFEEKFKNPSAVELAQISNSISIQSTLDVESFPIAKIVSILTDQELTIYNICSSGILSKLLKFFLVFSKENENANLDKFVRFFDAFFSSKDANGKDDEAHLLSLFDARLKKFVSILKGIFEFSEDFGFNFEKIRDENSRRFLTYNLFDSKRASKEEDSSLFFSATQTTTLPHFEQKLFFQELLKKIRKLLKRIGKTATLEMKMRSDGKTPFSSSSSSFAPKIDHSFRNPNANKQNKQSNVIEMKNFKIQEISIFQTSVKQLKSLIQCAFANNFESKSKQKSLLTRFTAEDEENEEKDEEMHGDSDSEESRSSKINKKLNKQNDANSIFNSNNFIWKKEDFPKEFQRSCFNPANNEENSSNEYFQLFDPTEDNAGTKPQQIVLESDSSSSSSNTSSSEQESLAFLTQSAMTKKKMVPANEDYNEDEDEDDEEMDEDDEEMNEDEEDEDGDEIQNEAEYEEFLNKKAIAMSKLTPNKKEEEEKKKKEEEEAEKMRKEELEKLEKLKAEMEELAAKKKKKEQESEKLKSKEKSVPFEERTDITIDIFVNGVRIVSEEASLFDILYNNDSRVFVHPLRCKIAPQSVIEYAIRYSNPEKSNKKDESGSQSDSQNSQAAENFQICSSYNPLVSPLLQREDSFNIFTQLISQNQNIEKIESREEKLKKLISLAIETSKFPLFSSQALLTLSSTATTPREQQQQNVDATITLQLMKILFEIGTNQDFTHYFLKKTGKTSKTPNSMTMKQLISPEIFQIPSFVSKLEYQWKIDCFSSLIGSVPNWFAKLFDKPAGSQYSSIHSFFQMIVPFEQRLTWFNRFCLGIGRSLSNVQNELLSKGSTETKKKRMEFLIQKKTVATVSRSHLLRDAFYVISYLQGSSISAPKSLEALENDQNGEIEGENEANLRLFEVQYSNEVGTGQGPTNEFFSLVSRELQKKFLGIWRENEAIEQEIEKKEEGASFSFANEGLFPKANEDVKEKLQQFRILRLFNFLGMFLARTILDSRVADFPFSESLIKLIKSPVFDANCLSFEDLKNIDRTLYKQLKKFNSVLKKKKDILKTKEEIGEILQKKMLENENLDEKSLSSEEKALKSEIEDNCLLDGVKISDLFINFHNSSEKSVNIWNLDLYILQTLDFHLYSGIKPQMLALKKGLFDSLQKNCLFSPPFAQKSFNQVIDEFFSIKELEILFVGEESVKEQWTIEYLKECTSCMHGYTSNSPQIQMFFEILSEFSDSEKSLFLKFVTGSSKLPCGGLKALKPKLTVVRKEISKEMKKNEEFASSLVSVMTCANFIKLPDYSTKEIMKSKLLKSMQLGQEAFLMS